MSSPIAIPRATKNNSVRRYSDDAHHHDHNVARSLPTNTSGVYVPVHRRGASASSLPEARRLSAGRPNERNAQSRTRSVSPTSTNRYNLLASATIPAPTMIPQTHTLTYSITDLLELSSSPAVGLSPLHNAPSVDSHIPLMMTRVSSPRTKKASQTTTTTPASPEAQQQKKSESSPRRNGGVPPANTHSPSPIPYGAQSPSMPPAGNLMNMNQPSYNGMPPQSVPPHVYQAYMYQMYQQQSPPNMGTFHA
ncbi:hypothetical protein NUW54_g13101 [Trametes sanguinea]|uniref:Uncharacterized protein n=1 Tax=Trametes sanguinea TaxID=158606 RepID=A0ACC1MPV2_9APHY|nr:hypothetical protein NUW54_g13101 [Trametes sanguinea]